MALGLVVGCVLASTVSAQSRPDKRPDADMSTLKEVRVTASQTTPDAVNCGPDLAALLPHVEAELASGGMRIVKSPRHLVTVSILTSHDAARGICSSAAMLGTYKLVSFFDEAKGALQSGYIVLWQRGKQVISVPTDHAAAVETAVNRLVDIFIKDWQVAGTAAQTPKK
jgi:hypothetical protein